MIAQKKILAKPESDLIYLLGGVDLIDTEISTGFDLLKLSNTGLKKASLDALIRHLGMSKKAFTENILNQSVKTFERKKSTDLLDKRTSSYIIEIAKVVEHTFEVFEDEDKVQRWLNTPVIALKRLKPIDLFETFTGLKMVDDVLYRIEDGIYF